MASTQGYPHMVLPMRRNVNMIIFALMFAVLMRKKNDLLVAYRTPLIFFYLGTFYSRRKSVCIRLWHTI